MQITNVVKRNTRPDYRLEGGSHPMQPPLSPNVQSVRPGTPIKPTAVGWEVTKDWSEARAIAATFGRGGEKVHARKSATFDIGAPTLVMGAAYRIADVDDSGYVTFVKDDDGPFYAESPSTIHMSVS